MRFSDDRTADASCRRRLCDGGQAAGWILAAGGHGEDWARVLHAGPEDAERIWAAISAAVRDAVVRDRAPHGAVCGVDVTLTINDRTSSVATVWHYPDEHAAPRLVTAYPNG